MFQTFKVKTLIFFYKYSCYSSKNTKLIISMEILVYNIEWSSTGSLLTVLVPAQWIIAFTHALLIVSCIMHCKISGWLPAVAGALMQALHDIPITTLNIARPSLNSLCCRARSSWSIRRGRDYGGKKAGEGGGGGGDLSRLWQWPSHGPCTKRGLFLASISTISDVKRPMMNDDA